MARDWYWLDGSQVGIRLHGHRVDANCNSGIDAGIKIRPTEEEVLTIGPAFARKWKEFFVDAPDKPILWLGPMAMYYFLVFVCCNGHDTRPQVGWGLRNGTTSEVLQHTFLPPASFR